MTPDIEKIEHLLNAKAFDELNAAERELVLAHLSGAAEYEHMRETLLRVKKVFTAEASAQAADADLKELILTRFEQHKPQPYSLAARIMAWLQSLFPAPAGRFAGALAMLLLVVTVAFFAWPTGQKEMAQQLLPPATEIQTVTLPEHALAPPTAESIAFSAGGTAEPVLTESSNAALADRSEYAAPAVAARHEQSFTRSSAADEKAGEAPPIQEESSVPVYRNSEGYYQYQNSRVAKAGSEQKKSEVSEKPVNKSNMKDKAGNARESSRADTWQAPGKGDVTTDLDQTDDAAITEIQVASLPKTGSRSIPAWPGTENRRNAHALTQKKLHAFFVTSPYALQDSLEPAQPVYKKVTGTTTCTITLSFDARGMITKVHVSGTDETRKKAIIRRALQLPPFKFTAGGNPVLQQTYEIEFP